MDGALEVREKSHQGGRNLALPGTRSKLAARSCWRPRLRSRYYRSTVTATAHLRRTRALLSPLGSMAVGLLLDAWLE